MATRLRASDFVIARSEDEGRHRQAQIEGVEGTEREHNVSQARFHVEHAGAVETVVVLDDGHLIERAVVPHRVAMAQQELAGLLPRPVDGTGVEGATGLCP